MKFKRRIGSKAPQLALTSMLDVIFLLLCFFVTVSVFSQWESEITIKLPSAATAEEPDRLPGEIIVNLDKDGNLIDISLSHWEKTLTVTKKHSSRKMTSSIDVSASCGA